MKVGGGTIKSVYMTTMYYKWQVRKSHAYVDKKLQAIFLTFSALILVNFVIDIHSHSVNFSAGTDSMWDFRASAALKFHSQISFRIP